MKKVLKLVLAACCVMAQASQPVLGAEENVVPAHLFKIVSWQKWQASQGQESLILPDNDEAFIHFSLPEQVGRVEQKYRDREESYVKLTINTGLLPGSWKFEVNPGSEAKYWHLYDGFIPMAAVGGFKVFGDMGDPD